MIEEVRLRRVLDSRGNPTAEAEVHTPEAIGRGIAPSGASTGRHEVTAFPEDGIEAALDRARADTAPELIGVEVTQQRQVDRILAETDGTDDFSSIGGNVACAISLATAWAASAELDVALYRYLGGSLPEATPTPFGNVIGGGAHAVGGTTFQEFLAVPETDDAFEAARANARVHRQVGELLTKRFPDAALGLGDEGAWNAPLTDEEALEVLADAAQAVGDEIGIAIRPALDVAASEFHRDGAYRYPEVERSPDEQIDHIVDLVERFDIVSVEDPLDESDFEGFAELTDRLGDDCLVVGDDLFTTRADRVRRGVETGAANAVLIKPNQVGTLTGTFETINVAHRNGLETIVSHRSGETEDVTIAHLAVAAQARGVKTGTVGGERTAKLNELIRIQEEL